VTSFDPEWAPLLHSGKCTACGSKCGPMTSRPGWQKVESRICPSGRRLDEFVVRCDVCLDQYRASLLATQKTEQPQPPQNDPFKRAFLVFVLFCIAGGIAIYLFASMRTMHR